MHSTGNDIVSLDAIDINRTLELRFYSKILCQAEIALYRETGLSQIPFERYVWLLWSIKESAYKYLQRHRPELVFSPTRCIVTELEIPAEYPIANDSITTLQDTGFDHYPVFKSIITVGRETLYSRSVVNPGLIFSVVNRDNVFEDIGWGVKRIDDASSDNQSTEVRVFLLAKLKSDLCSNDLQVAKNTHGCPVLVNGGINIPISLAHHGHWVSYSYQASALLEPA